ncbi:MAG: deoxyribodipyrimidine photo-lyase [Proteobacteria bacterium]|nr:deoxyribodipyrimidine photo-lyase [Pseudomonadota bacterium]
MKNVIHWFRRDLRLTDNTALHAASVAGGQVIPVYILSDWKKKHRWTGPNRQHFLCGSLRSLDANLQSIGSRLILRQGDALAELEKLAVETQAEAIFFNRDPDPHGRAVEERLEKMGQALGISIMPFKDVAIHERREVLTGAGDTFRVFTPYSKAWEKLPKPAISPRIKALATPASLHSLPVPENAFWQLPSAAEGVLEAGEKAARARMRQFLDHGISRYGEMRDLPAGGGTSRLSQDLRYGLLSIRELHQECLKKADTLDAEGRGSAMKYIAELVWREFYMQILWNYPEVLKLEFNPKYRGMVWPGQMANLERWKNGETGFPIVDAAMRELRETGFMHNRTRYFMQTLTDGEIASNNGGWQWSAGTGADAAPYFRIQNPWSQTKRFDAQGVYIKRWIPELRDVDAAKFQDPPAPGLRLAKGYPAPVVDHSAARDITLDLFKSVLL